MTEQAIKDLEYIRCLVKEAISEDDPKATLKVVDGELGNLRGKLEEAAR
jgi:hypothetical protein